MIEKLIDIIKYDSESARVDFKSEEYPLGKDPKKNELLKDISAMANHPSNDPKYILIGVKEENGMVSEIVGIETPTDQAQYQQFINSNLEPGINFEYFTFEHEGRTLAAFVIKGNQQRPYLFKKDVQRHTDKKVEYKVGDGFIRSGTSTRKLSRKDFEDIYTRRQEARDRKSDLKITPVFKELDSFWTFRHHSYTIDFAIENLSSKSLGFDAELQLTVGEGVFLKNAFLYLYKKSREQGLSASNPQYFPDKSDEISVFVDIEKKSDYYKVVRVKAANEKYAISIPQKDTNDNIFGTDVLVLIPAIALKSGSPAISAKLILRSDDFKDEPIAKTYKLDLKSVEIVPHREE